MCFALRNTVRRGRSVVPLTFLRMRSLRRSLPTILMPMVVSPRVRRRAGRLPLRTQELLLTALARLARLLAHALAAVANALAAVGLRRPEAADLGRGLADELLVGAVEHEDRALRVGRD